MLKKFDPNALIKALVAAGIILLVALAVLLTAWKAPLDPMVTRSLLGLLALIVCYFYSRKT